MAPLARAVEDQTLNCRAHTSSGSLAIFAAIRRASSRITVGPGISEVFGVPPVTAVAVKTVYVCKRDLVDAS